MKKLKDKKKEIAYLVKMENTALQEPQYRSNVPPVTTVQECQCSRKLAQEDNTVTMTPNISKRNARSISIAQEDLLRHQFLVT
jgi:hypothetical protein